MSKQHQQQQQQQQQQQRHLSAMYSGATIKVVSGLHHPLCNSINSSGSSSSHVACWQSEAESLSMHLTGLLQVPLPPTTPPPPHRPPVSNYATALHEAA